MKKIIAFLLATFLCGYCLTACRFKEEMKDTAPQSAVNTEESTAAPTEESIPFVIEAPTELATNDATQPCSEPDDEHASEQSQTEPVEEETGVDHSNSTGIF